MNTDNTRRSLTIFGVNYAPEPTGNAPFTTGLAEHLAGRGWAVNVVTGYPHYPAWKLQPAPHRATVNGVDVERHRHTVPRRSSAAQRGLFEVTWLLTSLPAALRKRDADVVMGVVPNLSGAVLARIAAARNRVPTVLWFQDLMGPGAQQSGTSGGGRVAGIVGHIETSLAKGASRVMLAAEGFRPHFEAVGIPSWKIGRARNWNLLPPASLERDPTRDMFEIDRDAFVALHSGNMGTKQGLEVVIGAAARAPEVLWVLQGDGNVRQNLESAARERDLSNIRFLPTLPSQDLANLLASADVLLVTQRNTVSDMSLPSKLASYATVGVPIVASVDANSETALELAEDGIGLVVEPGDPEALAHSVEEVARNTTSATLGWVGQSNGPSSRNSADVSLTLIAELIDQVAAAEKVFG